MDGLIFQQQPFVQIVTVRFINVPVILQYEDTPLIEVIRGKMIPYKMRIPIYHTDGTHLGVVAGKQFHPSASGRKAGVSLRLLPNLTVCNIGPRTLFEIKRRFGDPRNRDADIVQIMAELHAPDGCFIQCKQNLLQTVINGQCADPLELKDGFLTVRNGKASIIMENCIMEKRKIGILLHKGGGISIGCNRKPDKP